MQGSLPLEVRWLLGTSQATVGGRVNFRGAAFHRPHDLEPTLTFPVSN